MQTVKFAQYLAAFVEVARAGSFSAAGRERAAAPSSLVRQIDALERELGVRLFVRTTRSLALTDAGRRLLDHARRILGDLCDVRAEIMALDGEVSGVLSVACFPTFAKRYVVPVMERLTKQHPGLRIELEIGERIDDPAERFDVVIACGDLPDSGLIGAKFAVQRWMLCASAEYLQRYGVPAVPADLADHCLLDTLHGADPLGWSELLDHPAGAHAVARNVFRCDDYDALAAAALAGMGIAYLPNWVVGSDVVAGRLVRLLPDWAQVNDRYCPLFLLRALAQPPAKVRVFSDLLQEYVGTPPIWER